MAKQRILVQVDRAIYDQITTLSRRSNVPVAEIAGECVRQAFEAVEKEILARPEVQEHIDKLILDAHDLMALRKDNPRSK